MPAHWHADPQRIPTKNDSDQRCRATANDQYISCRNYFSITTVFLPFVLPSLNSLRLSLDCGSLRHESFPVGLQGHRRSDPPDERRAHACHLPPVVPVPCPPLAARLLKTEPSNARESRLLLLVWQVIDEPAPRFRSDLPENGNQQPQMATRTIKRPRYRRPWVLGRGPDLPFETYRSGRLAVAAGRQIYLWLVSTSARRRSCLA